MSAITTHILDTALGKPASNVRVNLELLIGEEWKPVNSGVTDADGRCRDLAPYATPGTYRLSFATGQYFARQGRATIYPEVTVTFNCEADAHFHLPLLLSDYGYATYRGS